MKSSRLIALVLLVFSTWGVLRHLHNFGEDLASSYVGCRLLSEGQGDHLYSHSTKNFSDVDDPVWDDMGRRTGFYPLKMLHPYVQTPLWAYSLQPVCTRVNFRVFCNSFYVLFMLCASGTLWLVARYWAPMFYTPLWMALACLTLYVMEPFKYAIFLAQTHILYIFMTVFALVLAERRRPVGAGVLLALAAAVKITPGFLLLYWLLTRQYKAALSFVIASCVLLGLTVALLGTGMMGAYVRSLQATSNVLLLAFNNQSVAAWLMGAQAPRAAIMKWTIYPLPAALKIAMLLLTVASTVFGGWLDRRKNPDALALPPYGAVFALLGATVFASIAWTHYFIILIVPMMFFVQAGRRQHAWGWFALAAVLFVLNRYPISFGSVHFVYKSYTVVRSQFYSGLLAMVGLAWLGLQYRRVRWQGDLQTSAART